MEARDLNSHDDPSDDHTSSLKESNHTPISQIPDSEIKRYINLLEQSMNDDEKLNSEAIKTIDNECISNIIKSLSIFSDICNLQKDVDYSVIHLSMSYINRILTPVAPITEELISEKWHIIDPSIHVNVKTAIFKGLSSPDSKITQISSQAFLTLLNIEKVEMFDMIPSIGDLYETAENSELTRITAIDLLCEICGKKSLGCHTEYKVVQQMVNDIFKHIIHYFQNCSNETNEIKLHIVTAFENFIEIQQQLFEDLEIANSIIDGILASMHNSLVENIHFKLIQILYKLVKIQYKNDNFNPDRIFTQINQQILEFNEDINNEEIIKNNIYFWIYLSNYEFKIIKNNILIKNANSYNRQLGQVPICRGFRREMKEEIFRDFCSKPINEISNKLISIMSMIDPNDKKAEASKIKTPYSYATICLQTFFAINPQLIYEKIKDFWCLNIKDFLLEKEINWITKYSLVLSLSIIFQERGNSIKPNIQRFFFHPFEKDFIIINDFVLKKCLTNCLIPRINETSLYSFSRIIACDINLIDESVYDSIFNWIKKNMRTEDENLFIRICVICNSFICFGYSKMLCKIYEKIQDSFDDIITLFHIGISKHENIQIINVSYTMVINATLFMIKTKYYDKNKIIKLIESQLSMLNESKDQNDFTREKMINITKFFSQVVTNITIDYLYPYLDKILREI